jgi:ketosteroid isomerase-like protein
MTRSSEEIVRSIYEAFARGDVEAILNSLDEQIDWRAPANLPHGGHFDGRQDVARFFQGIGEHWETLSVDVQDVLGDADLVVVLATIRGRLRATGEDTGYTAAHAWTLRDGTPIRFAETVDAPATLAAATNAYRT